LQEPQTLYKLMILYMLGKVEFPLTKAQISEFILDKGYTNYMTLQESFGDLVDAGMITAETVRNRTNLSLTKEGEDTLNFFEDRIGETIRKEIDAFLQDNKLKLRDEVSITSEYYKATTGEYEAHLVAKEKDIPLLQLTISVPDKESASAICDHWTDKNQEVYQYLVKTLF